MSIEACCLRIQTLEWMHRNKRLQHLLAAGLVIAAPCVQILDMYCNALLKVILVQWPGNTAGV